MVVAMGSQGDMWSVLLEDLLERFPLPITIAALAALLLIGLLTWRLRGDIIFISVVAAVLSIIPIIAIIAVITRIGYQQEQRSLDAQPEQFTPEQARALGGLQACVFGVSIKSLTEHKSPQEFHGVVLEECQKQIERVNEEYDATKSDELINYHLNSYKNIQTTHGR